MHANAGCPCRRGRAGPGAPVGAVLHVLGLTGISETFYFGGMPQEMALRNIRCFATEVIPAFAEAEAMAP
jgi:hypothetical protein